MNKIFIALCKIIKPKKKIIVTADNFWDTDLEDIESTFLKKGAKITDLPVVIDERLSSGKDILIMKK
jgi:hypothetical protein